jgi:hypothetical protein
MNSGFSLQHFRFHLEPKAPLRMPAYNKGSVIRGENTRNQQFRRARFLDCPGNRTQKGEMTWWLQKR